MKVRQLGSGKFADGQGHCREEWLSIRKRRARRRAVVTRAPIILKAEPNAPCALDFVQVQFALGRSSCNLNVLDDVKRECLAAVADRSISGMRVAHEFDAVITP